jgi:hypothetical protein
VYSSKKNFPSLVAPWRGVAQAPGLSGLTPGPGLYIYVKPDLYVLQVKHIYLSSIC